MVEWTPVQGSDGLKENRTGVQCGETRMFYRAFMCYDESESTKLTKARIYGVSGLGKQFRPFPMSFNLIQNISKLFGPG